MDQDVSALAEKARQGDVDAFAELVEHFGRRIFALSCSLLGDFHAAEDAAQETFLRAFKGISKLQNPEKIGSWLAGIAYRVSRTHQRKEKRAGEQFHPGYPDNLAFLVKEGPDETFKKRVLEAASSLDDDSRALLALKYLEGMSYADMAEIMGVEAPKIKSRLFSARRKLREKLGSYRPKN